MDASELSLLYTVMLCNRKYKKVKVNLSSINKFVTQSVTLKQKSL